MKKVAFILPLAALAILSLPAMGQQKKVVLNTSEVPEKTHVHLKDFPKDQVLSVINGWGGLTVGVNEVPAGTDFAPLLEGLKNDKCQVPHWGYMIQGAIQIDYEDGTSAVIREGEAYYMPPGHTAKVIEDMVAVEFSPEGGMHQLMDHLEKKMAEMSDR